MGIQKIVQKIYSRVLAQEHPTPAVLLAAATTDNTPEFGLSGLRTLGKALDVYDGDTLWLAFVCEHKVYRTRVRMHGYDSPEMKPKADLPERDAHIQRAIAAKQRLQELLSAHVLDVEFLRPDKYGRMLVKLSVDGACVNDKMVQENHGYAYFGGTKQT